MSVVGVDLGYQNSVVASAGRGGVDVVLNGASKRLNATMVGFSESRKMGEFATSGMSSNYANTMTGFIKRLLGLAFDDPRAQAEMKWHPGIDFQPVPSVTGTGPATVGVQVTLGDTTQVIPVEMAVGMMVDHMGTIVSSHPNVPAPQDWVVTIPTYFNDTQRRALLAGCAMVGIGGSSHMSTAGPKGSVLRLMHDNTATALAYGIFKDVKKEFIKDQPQNVMFIDMGATAYSVSVAVFEPGKLTIKSSFTDENLGGRDFDLVIAEWVAAEFVAKFGSKLSSKDPLSKPKSRMKLLAAAEKAKKTLSPVGVNDAHIYIEMLADDLDFGINLTASKYEELCAPILARLRGPIESALAESKLTTADLHSVEIVGGSTRIGCLKRALSQVLGSDKTMSTTMNADEAIARGAALQSAILSPRFKVLPYEIQEFQPYPIRISWEDQAQAAGVEVEHGATDVTPTDSVVMFDRGLNFPIVRRVTLRRSGDFKVESRYDEKAVEFGYPLTTPGVGRDICTFLINAPPLPEAATEANKVRINVKQCIHGIIHLTSAQMVEEIEEDGDAPAPDAPTTADGEPAAPVEKKKKIKKTNLEFTVSRPIDWTTEQLNRAYEQEVAMANTDRVVKETADMRNELESYIYDMRDKITSSDHLGNYGTEGEKAAFAAANEAMEAWLYEDGFDATKSVYAEKLATLKKFGTPLETRQYEAENRPAALSELQSALDRFTKWANESQSNELYSHIMDEERQKVRTVCDSVSSWLYDLLDKQGSLSGHADPVLKVADLRSKTKEVTDTCRPIMNRPAPKKTVPPPTPPPPAEAEKKQDPPGASQESKESTMEEDAVPIMENGAGAVEDPTGMDVD